MDFKKFISDPYEFRTKTIKVPGLKRYFKDGAAPEFTVRGLNASEWYRVKYIDDSDIIDRLIKGLSGKDPKKISDALLEILGSPTEIPHQMKFRLKAVEFGLIADDMPIGSETRFEFVLKFANVFPIEFDQISEKIFELTGMGLDAKKKPKEI